jgi:hypothetical protein
MSYNNGLRAYAHRGNSLIVYGNKVRSIYPVYKRGKAGVVLSEKKLVDARLEGFGDRLGDFLKRFDDISTNFGKRLDDLSTRLLSHDRTHLFLFGTVVGLFGLTLQVSGDLNKKIDDKFEKTEDKLYKEIQNNSNKIDDKFEKTEDKLYKEIQNNSNKIDDKFEKIEDKLYKEIKNNSNKIDNLIKEIKSDKKRAFLRFW